MGSSRTALSDWSSNSSKISEIGDSAIPSTSGAALEIIKSPDELLFGITYYLVEYIYFNVMNRWL